MFNRARIKLTAWYLLIVMLISITFSTVIYKMLLDEVERFERAQRSRIERRIEETQFFSPLNPTYSPYSVSLPVNTELIEEVQHRLQVILITINLGIFIFTGALGYILAGRTLRPIKQMVEEQHRFISDASHELKTPLTSLKTAFEVFLRSKKRTMAEADQLVQESIEDVEKLQSLSESLLSLALYQQSRDKKLGEPVQLQTAIETSIHTVEPMAKKKQITMSWECPDVRINGVKEELTELFVIFLDNAIKYSSEGSAVSLLGKRKDGNVVIEITDAGIGIPEKDIPHIFDRFYRADQARSHHGSGGYGLGLAIAKKIIELHKGTVRTKSTLGKGTTFFVELPIAHQKRG